MHIALLYNGRTLSEWQRQAIELIASDHRLSLLIYEEPGRPSRPKASHGLYYALNLAAIRNRLTRAVPWPAPTAALVKHFVPLEEGAWSALPADVLDWLRDNGVDAVIKFGLNLLRIPERAPPILSYHHGDPRRFRGRPAGFYELIEGEPFMGQIVQILSNKLDAGRVLAFTETRVHHHSYRKTMLECYASSPQLLPRALAALAAHQTVPLEPTGKNYRLPGNRTVARLLIRSGYALAKRLSYGAFMEKRWKVSTLTLPSDADIERLATALEARFLEWNTPSMLPGYTFYADGFFNGNSSEILLEAMSSTSGKGELVRVRDGVQSRVSIPEGGHLSYPGTIEQDGETYLVPEIADWSAPAVYKVEGDRLCEVAKLDIDADGILDPTLFRHEGSIYLLGNRTDRGTSELHLWVASGLFARFELHPTSPVRVGSRGSRMAGAVLTSSGALVRFGQDCRSGYGDGVVCFRIDRIDEADYQETMFAELSFNAVKGPHTLNRAGDTWLFDWYVERASPLAGVRRLLNRI